MNKYGSIHPDISKDIKDALLDKKILLVGTTHRVTRDVGNDEYEGYLEGGLTLVLEDKNGIKSKVILGYTDLGIWLENEEILGENND